MWPVVINQSTRKSKNLPGGGEGRGSIIVFQFEVRAFTITDINIVSVRLQNVLSKIIVIVCCLLINMFMLLYDNQYIIDTVHLL